MPYDAQRKKSSVQKQKMNEFLGRLAARDGHVGEKKALVIDAETLLSSTALVTHGMKPSNVVVINSDEAVIDKAVEQGHVGSVVGWSTKVLKDMHHQGRGGYDIVYLDYCGTPELSKGTGWQPHLDVYLCADMLTPGGVCVVTFTTGRVRNGCAKALKMIPTTLDLAKEVSYCETVPMYSMILVKGVSRVKPVRAVYVDVDATFAPRLQVNGCLSPKKRKKPITARRPSPALQLKKQKRKAKFKKGDRVIVRWGKDSREEYQDSVGRDFPGKVCKVVNQNGWKYSVKIDEWGSPCTGIEEDWLREGSDDVVHPII